jgi:predicted ribosomally synthesized peptide with SipW-like signal peptide
MSGRHVPTGEEYVLVPASKLRMSMRRKVIIGITALSSLLAVGIGTGTFASFSATTTNSGNVFSTGKLQLSDKVGTGTACLSGYSGTGTGSPAIDLDSNGNATCDAAFNLTLKQPGDTATAKLTIANSGDYNGLLKFWLPNGCVNQQVATPSGSQNLCTKLEVYVQETQADFTTNASTTCVFPASAVAACDDTWAASSDALSDLATAATSSVPFPSAGITLNTSSTKYFKVALRFANGGFDGSGNGVDNGYQNRRAAFDLVWRLQEA